MSEKILYLIRGIPGSGKTTLAHTLYWADEHHSAHYEADQFFTDARGEYFYDPSSVKQSHVWCQKATEAAMMKGTWTTIVSNTFTQKWEMKPYWDMAEQYGYKVVEIIMKGRFSNEHGVPASKVDEMNRRFEY